MSASDPAPHPAPSGGLIAIMAATTGLAVANIYYNQPMLGLIARDMPGALTALTPTVTQFGYALGLLLLTPLGDKLERRALIVRQFAALAAALALAALAPTPLTLLLASLAVGALATVAQQIVPMAAHLAPPEMRGAVIGKIMAGLLCGILLSRSLAGLVADHAGWRVMFWLGAPLALLAAAALRRRLPVSRAQASESYPALLLSLWRLWRSLPALRLATLTQGLLFAAFSAFWSLLALRLEQLGQGASVAGLFGVIGVAGVLAAPLAGRLADRRGPRAAILAGVGFLVLAWGVADLWPGLIGLALASIVLDLGVHGELVSHQHIVYGLDATARTRLNTLFMSGMFLLGAGGSALAALAWQSGGWHGVSLLGTALGAAAALLQVGHILHGGRKPGDRSLNASSRL